MWSIIWWYQLPNDVKSHQSCHVFKQMKIIAHLMQRTNIRYLELQMNDSKCLSNQKFILSECWVRDVIYLQQNLGSHSSGLPKIGVETRKYLNFFFFILKQIQHYIHANGTHIQKQGITWHLNDIHIYMNFKPTYRQIEMKGQSGDCVLAKIHGYICIPSLIMIPLFVFQLSRKMFIFYL